MNKHLSYRGFKAHVEFSVDDNVFWGRLVGIKDEVTFEGETVDGLKAAFKDAVDFHIELCEKTGERPKKSYSGKVLLRLPNSLHEKIAEAASLSGKSLNEWGKDVLESAVK